MKIIANSMARIASGDTSLPDHKIEAYRKQWADLGFDLPVWNPCKNKSSVGTKLHEIIHRETGQDVPCDKCAEEISALNCMTAKEARREKKRVVDDIYSRAWDHADKKDKLKLIADVMISTASLGRISIGKDTLGKWFDEAVGGGSIPEKKKRKRRAKKCNSCGKNRRGAGAGRKYNRSSLISGPPVSHRPLPEDVRKNLIYHIYPIEKMRWLWHWNLDQILQRIDLFNGRKIIGIVHDETTDPPDAVKEYLNGHGFEYIVEKNHVAKIRSKGLGENVTATKLMGSVRSFEPEVTFRAHAKGVTKVFGKPLRYEKTSSGTFSENGETVKDWTEIMYAVCLDDFSTVKNHLEQYAMTGPFRRNSRLGSALWYYSGSFYWYEHTRFYQRRWDSLDNSRIGVESLPGKLFKHKEVGCLHGDDAGSLYLHHYLQNKALPDYKQWKEKLSR